MCKLNWVLINDIICLAFVTIIVVILMGGTFHVEDQCPIQDERALMSMDVHVTNAERTWPFEVTSDCTLNQLYQLVHDSDAQFEDDSFYLLLSGERLPRSNALLSDSGFAAEMTLEARWDAVWIHFPDEGEKKSVKVKPGQENSDLYKHIGAMMSMNENAFELIAGDKPIQNNNDPIFAGVEPEQDIHVNLKPADVSHIWLYITDKTHKDGKAWSSKMDRQCTLEDLYKEIASSPDFEFEVKEDETAWYLAAMTPDGSSKFDRSGESLDPGSEISHIAIVVIDSGERATEWEWTFEIRPDESLFERKFEETGAIIAEYERGVLDRCNLVSLHEGSFVSEPSFMFNDLYQMKNELMTSFDEAFFDEDDPDASDIRDIILSKLREDMEDPYTFDEEDVEVDYTDEAFVIFDNDAPRRRQKPGFEVTVTIVKKEDDAESK